MEFSSELVRTLYEIGMMSAWRGDVRDAHTILDGVKSARPESVYPEIGTAVALMNQGRLGSALRVLESARTADPECDQTLWHMALVCKLAGYEDRCHKLCQEVLHHQRDPQAMAIAETLIAVPARDAPRLTTVR